MLNLKLIIALITVLMVSACTQSNLASCKIIDDAERQAVHLKALEPFFARTKSKFRTIEEEKELFFADQKLEHFQCANKAVLIATPFISEERQEEYRRESIANMSDEDKALGLEYVELQIAGFVSEYILSVDGRRMIGLKVGGAPFPWAPIPE